MKRIFPILLLVGIILGAGYWLGQHNNGISLGSDSSSSAKQAYICPMHSHIVQDHPGSCPICGMDLVPTGQTEAGTQIHVDTATQQKFGVRLATAEQSSLAREIHTYATLTTDAGNTHRITPTVEGVLVKLYATRTGQRIAAGEPLYEIFSQELLQLQNEYVDYFKRRSQSLKSAEETRARNRQMLESMHGQDALGREEIDKGMRQSEDQINAMLQPMSRDGERITARLKLAGFTDATLQQLINKGRAQGVVTIRAPHACTVSEVSARGGMSVSAMTDLLTCAESGRAWLEVVFYPDQTNHVHEGDMLQVQFTDGESMQTKLTGLSAFAEGEARTLRARIPFKLNAGRQLGDYADVTLLSSPFTALSVPASAVIRTGRGNFVMRALENGHFMPQKVETGIANDDRIVIRDGLEAGNKVAVNGQFLLDAAASIADAAQRYDQNIGAAHAN
jgi:Cu(I)/Ag(I) efflux system membrane fusion protein